MALSNILREPRREITESLIGLAVLGVPIGADVAFALWLQSVDEHLAFTYAMFLGLVTLAIGSLVVGVLTFIAFGVHAVGEAICDELEQHGIHLRPKTRR